MDFREREINFREADRRYADLKRQLDAGTISAEEFDAQRQQLMVKDDEGRWWAKSRETGDWNYHDGSGWVRDTPPDYQETPSEPASDSSPVNTTSPPRPKGAENGGNRRRKTRSWMRLAGLVGIALVGIALVGIVLVFWVLVPYIRGEPASNQQDKSNAGKQEEPASDGATFDSAFIHRATPENISTNSTYLDNPLLNDDPNVILYVTQNWNPGGGAGTYNDHPIGVWYDDSRQRWAIFNQDREPMPDGVAFNVAILEEPT
jgi:hypothetical protein